MLPIKHKKIFQNRWWAVVWAGGIIWSAVEFVGDQPSGQDASDNGAATAALVNAMG